ERYGAELPLPAADMIALAHSAVPDRAELGAERMTRFRYGTSNRLLDRYLRRVPVSASQKALGIR
uniref:hypothetical protein n=1 Tax=Stenotrophomonas maltophilia TaxID=40324 RepID=UPI00195479B4